MTGFLWRKQKKRLLEAVNNEQVLYVTPADESYAQLLAAKYENFAVQHKDTFPASLKEKVAWAFNTLEAEGFFHRDWVRFKGRSFPIHSVSRTLIGDPGVTYKYLGLRLFALPWTFPGRMPENDIERACGILEELNMHFKQMSRKLITEKRSRDSCAIFEHGNASLSSEKNVSSDRTSDHLESTISAIGDSSPSVNNDKLLSEAMKDNSYKENGDDFGTAEQENLPKEQGRILTGAQLTLQDGEHTTSTSSCQAPTSNTLPNTNQTPISNKLPTPNQAPTSDISPSANQVPTLDTLSTNQAAVDTSPTPNQAPTIDTSPSTSQSPSLEDGTNFNVALLNYMDPSDPSVRSKGLKEEPYYGMGELAVSWHMDTGLVPGTTVAVYNHTEQVNCERDDCNKWCVGLKVQWDVETPALAVPLDTGDSYYMLSDFNETHQHCVVVGSHPRFSSTHRVSEVSTGTLSYIQARCEQALQNLDQDTSSEEEDNTTPRLISSRIEDVTLTEDIHTEVEFDWLRQFWMQGVQRAQERDNFWMQPLEDLEKSWKQMELMTQLAIDAAMQGSSSEHHSLCNILIDVLKKRTRQRQECINRFGGKMLVTMPSDEIPSFRPYWQDSDPSYPLPFDLDDVIHKLECHLDNGDNS